jgi:hypothetical protein
MRPSTILFSFLFSIVLINALFCFANNRQLKTIKQNLPAQQQLVSVYGLTDLVLSTEARYTRHPSLSDPMAPYMDHPGSIEHFPSGSFVLPSREVVR